MYKKKSKIVTIVLMIVFTVLSGCAKSIEEGAVQEAEIAKKIEYREVLKPLWSGLAEQLESVVQSLQKAEEKPDMDEAARWASWYEAYKEILNDWTLIEEYGDFSYYHFYFDEDYGYDSYFLCDVDRNGIPELFLCSETTCIKTVFTYANELYWLISDDIYGINEETSEIVVLGHWHGSGGTGSEYECTGWKVSDNEIEDSLYIDFYDFSENGVVIPQEGDESFYVIHDAETENYEYTTDGAKYEELYAIHVKPCTLIEDYQLYNLSDSSGLDETWKESCLTKDILQALNVNLEEAELIVTDCRYSAIALWGYTDKGSFLKDFGFDGREAFFQYYEEDSGELQLELYYDTQTGRGCGIRYYPGTDSRPEGFAFNGSEKYEYDCEVIRERINDGLYETYYINDDEEQIPTYCLVLDHNLNLLCSELLSIHDITEDECGKRYGVAGPDLSDNFYVDLVRKTGGYEADKISHTYEGDYDGDGYKEAFVIIGNYMDFWGEATEDQISGDLWFVDHNKNATRLDIASFRAWQEYISQDGKTYLFLHHDIGLSWRTDIYTVQENEPVICQEYPGSKFLNETGQIIQIQDAYDGSYDTLDEFGWSGHTWKPYTFEFDHGELKEIPAKEVTKEEVKKIASLPNNFDEKECESVQYILRENGELNINTAKRSQKFEEYVDFEYFTYYVNGNGEWELTDEGWGIYLVQLYGKRSWDYLDWLET